MLLQKEASLSCILCSLAVESFTNMIAVSSLEVRFLMTGMKMEDFWCSEGRVGSRKYVFSRSFCDSRYPLVAGWIPEMKFDDLKLLLANLKS